MCQLTVALITDMCVLQEVALLPLTMVAGTLQAPVKDHAGSSSSLPTKDLLLTDLRITTATTEAATTMLTPVLKG